LAVGLEADHEAEEAVAPLQIKSALGVDLQQREATRRRSESGGVNAVDQEEEEK
jgi:hypothetical protein